MREKVIILVLRVGRRFWKGGGKERRVMGFKQYFKGRYWKGGKSI